MLKKIVLGTLLVGLIGVLIAGAVVRTSAKAGEGEAGGYGGRGRSAETAATTADNGEEFGGRWAQGDETLASGGQGGRGQGGGRWAQGGAATTGGGQGVGGGATEAVPAPQADVTADEWLTVQGTVVSVADDLVEIKTAAGEVIPFEGRPLSFAQEQGFSLKVGEAVELAGFDENGEFKLGQVTSIGSGTSITLRDASGRPGWAGRGRQG